MVLMLIHLCSFYSDKERLYGECIHISHERKSAMQDVLEVMNQWIDDHVHVPMEGFGNDELEQTKAQYLIWSQNFLDEGCSAEEVQEKLLPVIKAGEGDDDCTP